MTSVLLTIAGTDPSGAAGIQADLQVFRDFGFHGASVITAVLAQNTAGVRSLHPLDPALVTEQLAAVLEDLEIAAVKVGLVPSPEVAALIGARSASGRLAPVVWDPVLASGDSRTRFTDDATISTILAALPHIDVLTPNAPEAARLTGLAVTTTDEALAAAEHLIECGAGAVLLKSGHLSRGSDTIRDVWADAKGPRLMNALPAIETDVRGTGCQLSSAVAAGLASGKPAYEAAESAREYLSELLRFKRRRIGRGREVVVRT